MMVSALLRLPLIGWRLGRAGMLHHLARITLLPLWLRRLLPAATGVSSKLLNKAVSGAPQASSICFFGAHTRERRQPVLQL